MPMKPAAPERTAPIRKPMATGSPSSQKIRTKSTTPDDGDGDVLAPEVSLRALGDRRGDLLHPLVARIAAIHVRDRPGAIGDRKKTAQNNQPNHVAVLIRVPAPPDQRVRHIDQSLRHPRFWGATVVPNLGARRKHDFQPIGLFKPDLSNFVRFRPSAPADCASADRTKAKSAPPRQAETPHH